MKQKQKLFLERYEIRFVSIYYLTDVSLAQNLDKPVVKIPNDGLFMFTMIINSTDIPAKNFNASVHIEMRGTYGFLSAVDYPLLPVRIFCINILNET